jgi:phospholipid/cholesterol/gamma-HCH transport system permease protein
VTSGQGTAGGGPTWLEEWTGSVGRSAISGIGQLGRLTLLLADAAMKLVHSLLPGGRFRVEAAISQLFYMGSAAVPIVALIAIMLGAILAFQAAKQLEPLGADRLVADLVSVSMTRELGPVITAIVVAGRSGSAIAAEIASMKVQEEIDALRVMGINPVAYLVAPKLLAMLVALPLLTAMADLVGILASGVVGYYLLDMPVDQYLERCKDAVILRDFVSGLAKAGIFATIITAVGAFCGFEASGGAEEVGRTTTRSVVLSILLVIVADTVFTGLYYNFG